MAVVGATATGKTELAARLAGAAGADVVNADALQLYREMRLGVAKPAPAELARARHLLFDVATVREPWSLGRYVDEARPVVEEAWRSGRGVVLAGGTGMYVHGLLHGIDRMPEIGARVRERVRGWVARRGSARCHRLLRHVDPDLAARLHPRDAQRVGRGLEVYFAGGTPLSTLQRGGRPALHPRRVVVLGLRRTASDLAARIAVRVRTMYAAGLVAEAAEIERLGLREAVLQRKPIGYGEAFAVLDGTLTAEQAMEATARETWKLAKRQATWWRHRPVRWLDVAADGLLPFEEAFSVLGADGPPRREP